MSATLTATSHAADARPSRRAPEAPIDELAETLGLFSELTDCLHQSHAAVTDMVAQLQTELAERNRLLADQQRHLEHANRLAALQEKAAGLALELAGRPVRSVSTDRQPPASKARITLFL